MADDGLQVFVSDDGEFRLFPRLLPYESERQEFVTPSFDPSQLPDERVSFTVQRFRPVGEAEEEAARALLTEQDRLREEIAFLLEFGYKLLVGRSPIPGEEHQRWLRLYREYEHEEWFRKRDTR